MLLLIGCFILTFVTATSISALLMIIGKGLSMKKVPDINASSPFECGFEKTEFSMFSLRYFLVALVFLLFDLEILLLFPSTAKLFVLSSVGLTIFLTAGLFWEWNSFMLEWAK